jgi:hypothetical protein
MSNDNAAEKALADLVALNRAIKALDDVIYDLYEADLGERGEDVNDVLDYFIECVRGLVGSCRTADLEGLPDLHDWVAEIVGREVMDRYDVPPHDEHVGDEWPHGEAVAL